MKKIISIIGLAIIFCGNILIAQEVASKLNDASTAYNAGKLDDARNALQQALQEINKAIGKQILDLMPAKMNTMTFDPSNDNVSSTTSTFAGLLVSRTYSEAAKSVKVDIIGDSPLITGINAILAMPAFMTSKDSNQKQIKISGYKSLLQKNVDSENKTSYDLQIPVNQTLMTIHYTGIESENDVVAMANSLPISQIMKAAQ